MLEFQHAKNKICYIVTIPVTVRAFFIQQLKFLARHGYDVSVICSDDCKLQQELGADIHYIPINIPRGLSLLGSLHAIKDLHNIIKKERFDLVQYSTPNAAFCASIASKLAGIKVRNYHLMGFRYLGATGIGRIILKTIEKISCAFSTSIECVSQSNLELGIQENLFPREKAVVVWNGSTGGVDLSRFDCSKRNEWRQQIRSELGYGEDDFVFGFVGRITRDKGINEILEAFSACKSEAKLLLVGAEEGLDTLDQTLLQNARQDPNIQFHHPVSDVERYYAAIDILLLPSYREGFGNVIIEAAAVGTPAIVSNIPGPIDAIEKDKTAYVIPPKDVAALTAAMKKSMIKSNGLSSEYCANFAAEKFDSKKLCKKIFDRKRKLLYGNG